MNVLIVKTSAIGDVIQSFEVLEYLKFKFPSVNIDWVVSPSAFDLVSSHPLVRRSILVDFKGPKGKFDWRKLKHFNRYFTTENYDILFDLQGNTKSGIISFFCKAKYKVGFGDKSVAEWPNLLSTSFQYDIDKSINIKKQYVQLVKAFFKDHRQFEAKTRLLNIDPLQKKQIDLILCDRKLCATLKIMVCPSSRWESKMLHKDTLRDLLVKIREKFNVSYLFLWGSEEERKISEFLNLSFPQSSIILDKLKLSTLQNLMSRLDLVIAMDSFALHLAASANTSTFGVFGPTSSTVYMPECENSLTYQGTCPQERGFEKRCPFLRSCSNPRCMQDITVERLFDRISKHRVFK